MSSLKCPPQDLLQAFAAGDLPETEIDLLAEHFESCRYCEERISRLDDAADTLLVNLRRRLPASSDIPTASVEATSAVGGNDRDSDKASLLAWDDFRIIREIGHGGMGTVYEAYQGSLNRHVALKMLPERGDLARFRREAKAAGRLHHTNIVPVFGVGEHRGRHFYLMQFIAGRGLDVLLRERRAAIDGAAGASRRFSEAARVGMQTGEALAYAHSQGIIHRDIKPSNILLDQNGAVWITDFGLAYDSADNETLTATGDILGTLRYMPPERISGRGDSRADIYGLGVSLYEMICGQPPFAESDRARLLNQVLHHEPRRPRQLDPRVPRDLETIVLKAMARDPAHRYATASELADDLRRFLEDRPIRTRRAGTWERGVRWCRRNPVVAALVAALALVFVIGFASVTLQWRRANTEANRANAEAKRANETALAEARARAAESALRIDAQAEVTIRDFDRGLAMAQRGDVARGLLWMVEALRQAPSERPEVRQMARANLAAWANQAPSLRTVLEHRGPISQAVFSPDGTTILTGSFDGTAQVWDTATGKPLGSPLNYVHKVENVAFTPDGRLAMTAGHDSRVLLWDIASGQSVGPILSQEGQMRHAVFSPDGKFILTGNSEPVARLWSLATGQAIGDVLRHDGAINHTAFSPDGRLALTSGGTFARLWDAATGRPASAPMRHDRGITSALFSADSRLIVTGGIDGMARLWDGRTGLPTGMTLDHGSRVWYTMFSPSGKSIVTVGGDGTVRFWDVATGRPRVGRHRAHRGEVKYASFSPDGKLALTGGDDNAAWLWDVSTGRPLGSSLQHRLPLSSTSFSPDGKLALTASEDGTAKLWDVRRQDGDLAATGQVMGEREDVAGVVAAPIPAPTFGAAAFSPDRSLVLLGGNDGGLVRLVDIASGQPAGPPILCRWPVVSHVRFSPDGHHFAIASHDRPFERGGSLSSTCQVWDAVTGQPASALLPHYNWVGDATFRADGQVLATGDYGGGVHLWDAATGARLGGPFRTGGMVVSIALSPDGRVVAAGTPETKFQALLWDVKSGQTLGEPIQFRKVVSLLAFSPDGSRLAAGSDDGTARLIDAATGQIIGDPIEHADRIIGLTFSFDGRSLLTACAARTGMSSARLWDARSARPISPLMTSTGSTAFHAIAFRPDNTSFAIGCEDGTVQLWDIESHKEIGPRWMVRRPILAVAFSVDGGTMFAVDDCGDIGRWVVSKPATDSVSVLTRRLQVRSGLAIDSAVETVTLTPGIWRRWRNAEEDDLGALDSKGDVAWHDTAARDAESVGDEFAAHWHLDRLLAARPDDGLLYARRARALLLDGAMARCEADVTRAMQLGPRDQILDWLAQSAKDFESAGRTSDALFFLNRVIAARAGDWLSYAMRAELSGTLGRTMEREADLERAIERGPGISFLLRIAEESFRGGRSRRAAALYDRAIAAGAVPYEVWMEAALAHLDIDDVVGYQRVCEALRSRHRAEQPEFWVKQALANPCTLGEGGVGGDGKALDWARSMLSALRLPRKDFKHFLLNLTGMLLYRSGRYREAADRINEGIAADDGRTLPEDLIFLAMSYQKLNDNTKARETLARLPSDEPEPSTYEFWAIRATRLLGREARRLILDPGFPADPFAR